VTATTPASRRGRHRETGALSIAPRADGILNEVARHRATARRILREETLTQEGRGLALGRLLQSTKESAAPQLAAGAILAEIGWSMDGPHLTPEDLPGDGMERRHLYLRSQGFERCEHCRSALLTEADVLRARAIRKADIEELRAREGAVSGD
jgi:hypothetical protein